VTLELFLSTSLPADVSVNPLMISYVRIMRKYNFTHVNPDKNESRVFSQLPLDSLLSGVFLEAEDANRYREHYASFKQAKLRGNPPGADPFVREYIDFLCKSVLAALEVADFSGFAELCIILTCCLSPQSSSVSFLLKQISTLGCGPFGRLLSCRDTGELYRVYFYPGTVTT
jgi:hypothetical protein